MLRAARRSDSAPAIVTRLAPPGLRGEALGASVALGELGGCRHRRLHRSLEPGAESEIATASTDRRE